MAQRTVERLSLSAPHRVAARRAVSSLHQAFATATLPRQERPGTLLVRRLDLGRFEQGASSARLSRRIAARMRVLHGQAVYIDAPAAARAEAVLLRDPIEPLVALASLCARGQAPSAWFWPLAVPGVEPGMAPARVLARVLAQAGRSPLASTAVSMVLRALIGAGQARWLLEQLDPQQAAALVPWAGAITGDPSAHAPSDAEVALVLRALSLDAGRPLDALRAAVARWGEGDARALLLAWSCLQPQLPTAVTGERRGRLSRAALALAGSPPVRGRASDDRARGALPAVPAPPRADGARRREEPLASAPAAGSLGPPTAPGDVEAPLLPSRTLGAPSPGPSAPARPAGRQAAAEPPAVRPAAPPPRRWALLDGPQPTAAGGLLFVLPILERLGIERYLEDEAHAHFGVELARRLLLAIADRFELAPEDAMRVPLMEELSPRSPVPGGELQRFIAAIQDWLARFSELTLQELVLRPASLLCTRTHLDLVFDLQQVDVRVRRVGLDLNPGWAPHLGYVVTYHYVHGGRLDALA